MLIVLGLSGCQSSIVSSSIEVVSSSVTSSNSQISSIIATSSVVSSSSSETSYESTSEANSSSEITSSSQSSSEIDDSSYDVYAPIVSDRIKNVILFIGDGMGFEHIEAATLYKGTSLAIDSASLKTEMTTNSLSSGYTDSAAAATAMATGTKVFNGSVRMNGTGQVLPNFIDQLNEVGVRSGFLTSDTLYGGTPAGFLSYATSRNNYANIMANMTESKADLIMGIAPRDFDSLYETNFLSKGFTSIGKMSGLSKQHNRIISALPAIPAVGTGSSLDKLTTFALDFLDNNENGFFLGVEGAAIDHKAHDGLSEAMILELLAMDQALEVALKWASNRTDTAIIVTADHETGGLLIDDGANSENILSKMTWTTTTHTTSNVPFYCWGLTPDHYGKLTGVMDNTDVYHLTTSLLSNL